MNRILEKFKNRYNILVFVLAGVFLVLLFKLASLTLVRGDEFRELSNNKRLKNIPITSPRGEIRDRYGRLLAGNKVSFTVQLIKDDLNMKDEASRNQTILELIHILKSEGTTYNDEFPILLNSYRYTNENMGPDALDPAERVSDIIIENNLISEFIGTSMKYSENDSVSDFITGKKIINVLENEGIDMPIDTAYDEAGNITFIYLEGENIEQWQNKNGISANSDPKSAVIQAINNKNASKIVFKTINDTIASKLAYEMLDAKGLTEGIELEPMVLQYDEEYEKTKKGLIENFESITMETSAVDDFINILKETGGINEILEETFTEEDIEVTTVPGEVMLEIMKDNKISMPIKVNIIEKNEDKNESVVYKYKNDKEKDKFLKENELPSNTKPLDAMLAIAEKKTLEDDDKEDKDEEETKISILEKFIKHDDIKFIAQNTLLKKSSNPKISIAKWEYTPLAEKEAWLTRNNLEEDNIKVIFEKLKENTELRDDLTDYEARDSLLIIDELNKVGYRGYDPINIAYGINDKTVAKLEENKLDLPGVEVSLEPIRDYPNGKLGSHILGHMGKIAKKEEIDKYIKEKDYIPSTLIGQTGVEVEFEDYLKGKDGRKIVETDAYGNIIKVVEEEAAKPGDTLYLTIDSELQRVAEESLEKALVGIRGGGAFESEWGNFSYGKTYPSAYSGAAVAIDVKTGDVLALASFPGADPNLFSTGISSEDWAVLNPEHDEGGLPLNNIAISAAVQPGSAFKMVTGLAGLENGISPEKTIYDYGVVQVGQSTFSCLIWQNSRGSHGATNIERALEKSCNYYFYSVALGRIPQTGEVLGKDMDITKVFETAKKLGLDEKTGIEIPGERTIPVPSIDSKIKNKRVLLERFLKSEIQKFGKDGKTLNEEEIKSAVEEITSWLDLDKTPSKNEVIDRLDNLGINGEKKVPNNAKGEDLADVIKYKYLNASGWGTGDSLNTSIGQGDNAYTPLQMANYIATLSNGGYRHNVSIVDRTQTYDNTKKTYQTKKDTKRMEMNDYNNLNEIGKGMARVAKNEGTARRAFSDFPVDVAAKTGTAQRDGISPVTKREYDNYAWFTAYGPYEENNPDAAEIAVAVVLFQGGSGGNASPVAREIIAEYLNINVEEKELDKFNLNTELAK